MTNNEMLDYIINSERWGEPTCVEEATKNHEIEKWLRKQIEINEILKTKLKDDLLSIVAKKRFFSKISCKDEETIREWLENDCKRSN